MPQPSCMCTVLLKLSKGERLKVRKCLVHVLLKGTKLPLTVTIFKANRRSNKKKNLTTGVHQL